MIRCYGEYFPPLERLLLANKTTNKIWHLWQLQLQLLHSSRSRSGFDEEEDDNKRRMKGGKMISAEISKLSGPQQLPKSSVWVTAANFHAASTRCWSRNHHRIIILSSNARMWLKMAQISLALELTVQINLYVPWRTTHWKLWLSAWDLAHFLLGNTDTWWHVTVCDGAKVQPELTDQALLSDGSGVKNEQIFMHFGLNVKQQRP